MATEPAPISFARGAPSLDIIDVEGLKAAADRAFTNDPARTFGYGTSVGYVPLREWIAEQHGVAPEQVIVTNGSMQADAFLFSTLVEAGDSVVVESPSYDRTLSSLQGRHADLHALTLEADGVAVNELRDLLAGGSPVKLAHLIPNFQNPAGYTLAGEKRTELVDLARSSGMTIFEDDPYVELRFTGERLPTMLSLATGGEVVYASSFSKTVCPGIRVGYLVGEAGVISRIAKLATSTYISPNMVAQSIVHEFIQGGSYERSIETVKKALSERVDVLAEELTARLPQARFVKPEGGYFLWLTFDEDVDGDALFAKAADRGLAVVKGSDFLINGAKNSLRLAYSGVGVDDIREGVTRLAAAYGDL
ncbi:MULTISPECIES: PLP-dependent aminotransferase family protein [unclassified Pseudactinotalea]|uniref:aminotransferase-like domain-containing protein n=1 Tax=unclassified Pseudactinotalea TaxID=2649176 RepID=UPI00128B900D|nr:MULTISPECIES: PLP-dependent aminotransferase family protein [unclassified Pseudactinotalea]MPV51186.1 aminotransferase class I/II-fold pyridoxal phosphate-dependent enzyme [Pseudactinotalea sp. HY160]QGH69025.1 aminotransferase class I/II-fold pyridoxal phosphate-dependent enzyme [Pseudactinotalea sp. HY158]